MELNLHRLNEEIEIKLNSKHIDEQCLASREKLLPIHPMTGPEINKQLVGIYRLREQVLPYWLQPVTWRRAPAVLRAAVNRLQPVTRSPDVAADNQCRTIRSAVMLSDEAVTSRVFSLCVKTPTPARK